MAAQFKQTAAAADAERRDAEQRQTDAGDDEADERGPHVAPGHLPHIDRENQIPRAEKHAEKHAGNVDVFTPTETFFHGIAVPLLNLSIRMAADGSRKLTYMVTSRRAKGNINYLMWALLNVIIPSIDKDTHGFDGQKNAHAASKPLPIHKVLPAGFSLPERISAPTKLLRT